MSVERLFAALVSAELALLTVSAFGLAPVNLAHVAAAQSASLIDCREFVDQAEAQRFFEVKGGPYLDPYHLDGDSDGIACEPEPVPTPVSQSHAQYCEGFLDYLKDSEASDDTAGERYRRECADWIAPKRGPQVCPAYQGLSFRFFSSLTRDQVDDLTEMQMSEYDYLMSVTEGECVPVDVARTSAWQCQSLPYYLAEFEEQFGIPINTYYRNELTERYQVVCLGATLEESRKFSMKHLIGAAIVGAGAVYLYGRSRKNRETASQP